MRRPSLQNVVDQRLPDDLRQELVHDDPLVVPAHQALRFAEDLVRAPATIARGDVVDRLVVEHQERRVQTGKDDVLVVARIAEDRRAVRSARQIFEQSAVLDAQLDPCERLARAAPAVQLRAAHRSAAVHRVEVQRRRARVRRILRPRRLAERRAQVERDVVIDELAEERRAGRLRGVVRIVDAERRIGDEQDRAAVQRILRIHDAARLAELGERGRELRTRASRTAADAEDSAEAIFAQRGTRSLRVRG